MSQAEEKLNRLLDIIDQAREPLEASIYAQSVGKGATVKVLTLSLDTAKLETSPLNLGFPFSSFAVLDATDSNVSISIKLNSQDSNEEAFEVQKGASFKSSLPVAKAYAHWDAQANKTITLAFFFAAEFATNRTESVVSGGVALDYGSTVTPQTKGTSSSTASELFSSDADRKKMEIQNLDSVDIFISGDNTVTLDSGSKPGIKVSPGEVYEWTSSSACYVISASSVTAIGLNKFS